VTAALAHEGADVAQRKPVPWVWALIPLAWLAGAAACGDETETGGGAGAAGAVGATGGGSNTGGQAAGGGPVGGTSAGGGPLGGTAPGGGATGGNPAGGSGGTGGSSPQECTLGSEECAPGDTCRPNEAQDALSCQTPGGTAVGDACTGGWPDECVADSSCQDVYEDGHPSCFALCTFEDDAMPCGEGRLCVPIWGAVGLCFGDDCTPPDEGCGPDRRCAILGGEIMGCVPVGDAGIGESCELEDCVAGATCVSADGQTLCRQLCLDAAGCTVEAGTVCVWPGEALDWGYCREGCNPVTQTGCGGGEACYWEDPAAGSTLCFDEGSLAPGADCSSLTQLCQAGYDCFPDDATNTTYHCRAWCDDTHPCTTGSCQSIDFIRGWRVCTP
jgi:hypothetical protein